MIIAYKKYLSIYFIGIINYESKTIYHGIYCVILYCVKFILKK